MKDSNCTNYITESCRDICPGCEIKSNSIWDTNVLLIPSEDDNYKPHVQKLLQPMPDANVEFVVEISNYGKWFRILRLKNNRRTHDFIINEFKTREIIIENDRSQCAKLQCAHVSDIKQIFQGLKLYVKYDRRNEIYVPIKTSETSINSLVDFWQRDLQSKQVKRAIQGDIFTDVKNQKRYQILKGQIPTQLDEYFIWLKKPEKGVHKTAPKEWFAGQTVNTTGLYPLELIRFEKFIALVVPLDSN